MARLWVDGYLPVVVWFVPPAEVGDKVDEMKHLVEERVVEGDEDNVIVAVLEKGYEIGGRLVR
jgi:molecular chaperone GrpE (heat shock protein)